MTGPATNFSSEAKARRRDFYRRSRAACRLLDQLPGLLHYGRYGASPSWRAREARQLWRGAVAELQGMLREINAVGRLIDNFEANPPQMLDDHPQAGDSGGQP